MESVNEAEQENKLILQDREKKGDIQEVLLTPADASCTS